MSDHTIRAADFCGPDDGAVDSAMRLTEAIIRVLESSDSVSVSMESLPGASSSFFNVIFSELRAKLGVDVVKRRIAFLGLGKTQTLIANRSRVAVLDA